MPESLATCAEMAMHAYATRCHYPRSSATLIFLHDTGHPSLAHCTSRASAGQRYSIPWVWNSYSIPEATIRARPALPVRHALRFSRRPFTTSGFSHAHFFSVVPAARAVFPIHSYLTVHICFPSRCLDFGVIRLVEILNFVVWEYYINFLLRQQFDELDLFGQTHSFA
jgi:hypothetical protein